MWRIGGDSAKMSGNRGGGGKALFFPKVFVSTDCPALIFFSIMARERPVTTSAPNRRCAPGERLRAVRVVLGLSLRDVYHFSVDLAKTLRNPEFLLPSSRLHEFETRNVIPSIHRLYTLACAYQYDMVEFLNWYGIPRTRTSEHSRAENKLRPKSGRYPKHSVN